MDKNSIVLYKSGKFYNAYGDNGIILHKLLGYKFVSYKNSAGFPESAIGKVKAVLEKEKLSYVIYEKNTFICDYKGVSKNYNRILKESLKNLEMEERLSRLQSKIDNFTLDDLEKVIEGIEDGTVEE